LIKSFGYTTQQTLLYGTPGGAVEIAALWASGYLGDRTGQRLASSSIFILLSIIGMIMIIAVPEDKPAGRLVGYYLTQAVPAGFVAILSLISSNVAGYTKKTTVAALYLIAYCVGNIIGPQTFKSNDYVPAEITIIVCWSVCLFFLVFIWWYCHRENMRKTALRAEPGYAKLENQVSQAAIYDHAEYSDITYRSGWI
jgi:MFS transporter, ACS family, allantoate permease